MTHWKQFAALAFLSGVALFSTACPPSVACRDDACPSGTVCSSEGNCVAAEGEGEGAPAGEGEGEGAPGEGEGEGGVFTLPTFAAEDEFDLTIAAGQQLVFDVVLNDAQLPCDVNGAAVDPDTLTANVAVPVKQGDTFLATLHCANVANLAPVAYRVLIQGVVVSGLPAIGAPVNVTVQAANADVCIIDDVSFPPSQAYTAPAESTALREVTCQASDGGAATTTFLLPVHIAIENVVADNSGVHFTVAGDADVSCIGATEQNGVFTQPLPSTTTTSIACHAVADATNAETETFTVFQGDVDATTYDTLSAQLVTGNVTLAGVDHVDDRGVLAIGGDFTIEQTTAPTVTLPSLAIVGGKLTIAGNSALSAVALTDLTRVGSVDVENNASLAAINAPLLASVAGDLLVSGNGNVGATFKLGLSALLSVGGSVTFLDNPGLSTGLATSLVTQIDDAGFGVAGRVTIVGNGN